jgi:hypothetical protein
METAGAPGGEIVNRVKEQIAVWKTALDSAGVELQ